MKLKKYKLGIYVLGLFFLLSAKGCVCHGPSETLIKELTDTIVLKSADTIQLRVEYFKTTKGGYRPFGKKHAPMKYFGRGHIVKYRVKVNDRPYSNEIYKYKTDDDIVLEDYRNNLKIELSLNKLHILVKKKGKSIGVFHFLPDGPPFNTMKNDIRTKKRELKRLTKNFYSNSLPKPVNRVIDYIARSGDKSLNLNGVYIRDIVISQDIGTELDEALLNYLGNPIADAFYSDGIRGKILAEGNEKWRELAIVKISQFLTEVDLEKKISISRAAGAFELVENSLRKYLSQEIIDKLILPNYPLYKYTSSYYNAEEERIIEKEYLLKMRTNSFKILEYKKDNYEKISLICRQMVAEEAMTFLVKNRAEDNLVEFEKIVAACFQMDVLDWRYGNLRVFTEYHFSKKEKDIINKHARRLISEYPDDDEYHISQIEKCVKY